MLFAVIYFKKYSAIPQKEGNFKLTSPTFVSVKSNRYRANQRNGDGTDTNVHDREIDMTNIYDNCDVNSITVSEENMSLAIENGRTTPTCGRYSPANTASRSPSPPRVQSNNALNTNLKSPVCPNCSSPSCSGGASDIFSNAICREKAKEKYAHCEEILVHFASGCSSDEETLSV